MASLYHQSHSRGEASTSYGGDDLSYMVSVAHIEVFVAITSSIIRTSEPRGGTLELDPQRGEVSRQARLSQSFLLSEVVRIPSTVPTPPIELTMGKCGGEAQHSQSWGLGVLRDSRMFKVR